MSKWKAGVSRRLYLFHLAPPAIRSLSPSQGIPCLYIWPYPIGLGSAECNSSIQYTSSFKIWRQWLYKEYAILKYVSNWSIITICNLILLLTYSSTGIISFMLIVMWYGYWIFYWIKYEIGLLSFKMISRKNIKNAVKKSNLVIKQGKHGPMETTEEITSV